MGKTDTILPTPPDDHATHLAALHKAYSSGDIIAILQATNYSQQQDIALPPWAINPLEETLLGVVTLKRGVKGRGNSAFGDLRKALIRTVRASAYSYVRAWQKNPHRYRDLPTQTFGSWYSDELFWQVNRKSIDAARLASTSLHGTEFVANASTLRRAAYGFPAPIRWGRKEAEERLGLRGPSGIFGPPPGQPPAHVQSLLSKRSRKS